MTKDNQLIDLIEETKVLQEKKTKLEDVKKQYAEKVNNYLLHVHSTNKTPEQASKDKAEAFANLEEKKKCDAEINMLNNVIHNNKKLISLSMPKEENEKMLENDVMQAKKIQGLLKRLGTSLSGGTKPTTQKQTIPTQSLSQRMVSSSKLKLKKLTDLLKKKPSDSPKDDTNHSKNNKL